ncbi:MAG: hypothetical protein ACLP74_08325 [Thermoplasmata archaeon]
MRPRGSPPSYTEMRRARAIAGSLAGLARESGRPGFKVDEFPDRFRIQKAVFLLKRLGEPSAQAYQFNQYVNGPYSPELASDYYDLLKNAGLSAAPPKRPANVGAARVFAEADSKTPAFMEGLATTLNLHTGGAGGVEAAISWARQVKPHLPGETWKEVREFLRAHALLVGGTSTPHT